MVRRQRDTKRNLNLEDYAFEVQVLDESRARHFAKEGLLGGARFKTCGGGCRDARRTQ